MMSISRIPSLACVGLLALALLGCGGTEADQPSSAAESGGTAGSPVEPEATAASEPEQASLPENFPDDFPLPDDFRISEARFVEGDAATRANFLVKGSSASGVAEIAALYQQRLPELGYTLHQMPVAPEATSALVYFQGEKFRDASVQLNAEGDRTAVLINLPLRD